MLKNTLRTAGALSMVMLLAACPDGDDDDQSTETESQATVTAPSVTVPEDNSMQITGWDNNLVVALDDLEIVLPNNRLFHLDAVAFCPSLSGQVETMEEYQAACRDVIQDKAQYYVDVYACRGHGDTFYAYMPTSTLEAELPFTTHRTIDDINPNVLFQVENMERRYENFGHDEFTVSSAERAGDREYSHSDAMTRYIAEERGNHRANEGGPVCTANYQFNLD